MSETKQLDVGTHVKFRAPQPGYSQGLLYREGEQAIVIGQDGSFIRVRSLEDGRVWMTKPSQLEIDA